MAMWTKHVVSNVSNLNHPLSSSCKNSLETSFPSPGSQYLYAKNPAVNTTLCFKASGGSRNSCVSSMHVSCIRSICCNVIGAVQ